MDSFNIMGIDPGSRTVGVCIYTISPKLELIKIYTYTLNIDSNNNEHLGIHENILERTSKLETIIKFIYHIYNPMIVAMESSFINMSRMGAVIPLTKSIHSIESILYNVDKHIKLISMPPGVIKKVFNSKQVGKDAVLDALEKHKHITEKLYKKKVITEHEVDAIAIAYALLEYIKTTEGMICIRYLNL